MPKQNVPLSFFHIFSRNPNAADKIIVFVVSLMLTCNKDIHQLIQQTIVNVGNICVAVAPVLLKLDLYVESFANIAEANMVTFNINFSLFIVSGDKLHHG